MSRSLARRGAALCLASALFFSPTVAKAAADEEEVKHDARLDNYPTKVVLEDGGGTTLTWFLLALLGAMCVGVMFKSANRTHLD